MKPAQFPLQPKALLLGSLLVAGIAAVRPVSSALAQEVSPSPTPQPVIQQQPAIEPALINSFIRLSAIPPRLGDDRSLKGKPGETIQAVIRVKNTSETPLVVSTHAQDFVIGEDGVTPIPVTEETSNRWSLASWITVSPENQTVAPNQSGNVNVVINVPNDALPGGHYAMIMHEPVTEAAAQAAADTGAQASIGQRVGTLVYFMVDGPINEEAFIRNFDFKNVNEYGPVPFNYTVENMSDIHITPRVNIDIHNIFGQKVDTIIVEPKNVFPLMSRNFEGQWDRVWGIGLYTAKLTMNFGDSGQVVMANDTFWLIPYTLVIAGVIVILTLLALIIVIRRHLIHRGQNEQARIQELEQRLQELEGDKLKKFDE